MGAGAVVGAGVGIPVISNCMINPALYPGDLVLAMGFRISGKLWALLLIILANNTYFFPCNSISKHDW